MAYILVADDMEGFRAVLARMVARMGHHYELASDLGEVRQAVRRSQDAGKPFDLLILDYRFIGSASGPEIMASLGESYCADRVIMLAGEQDDFGSEEAKALGVMGFLRKPLTYDDLADTVSRALARRGAMWST
jgi:DNA-binding NtrC family response regulator